MSEVKLYLGDCLEIMPTLEAGSIDAVITDPPYGVMLGDVKNGQAREKNQQAYTMFEDSPEYIVTVVVPAIKIALSLAKRGVITPGNRNAFKYPEPDDIGVWYNPAGTGRGKWGFIPAHLIFYYGVDPRAGRNSVASSTWGKNDSVSDMKNTLHPCPKPLKFTRWLIEKATLPGDIVIDPFMGSGTTGVACVQLRRHFIGIELDPAYFAVAENRIAQAQRQMVMPL